MISTLKHLAYTLKVDLIDIEYIIENIDDYYSEWKKEKKNKEGKTKIDKFGNPQVRTINPSLKDLKEIQRKINSEILFKLTLPDYAYGGIKNKDNIKNAKKHQGKKYIFTTDLKDFFPSISHHKVFLMFRSFNFSPTVSRILTQLTTYKGQIPQGAPTSSIIANLVFITTGTKLENFAKENNITFTSFIDDLTFSAPIDFKDKAKTIIETIVSDGYRISHNKTNYKTKNPIVTGIVVKNNSLDLPESYMIKLDITEGKSPQQINGLQNYADRVVNSSKK